MARYPRPLNSPYIPDATGDEWYIIFGVPKNLLSIYEKLVLAARQARNIGRKGVPGLGQAEAVAIDLLIGEIQTRVDRIALSASLKAAAKARDMVKATAVRPDTATAMSKTTKLVGSIEARPIILPGLTARGLGAVGVGNVVAMEAATINPLTGSRKGYWQAQEDGSSHMVGKRVPGVFQPGEAAPDPALDRVHAAFEKRGPDEVRYSMLVTKPIQARHFLKEGAGYGYEQRKIQLVVLDAFIVDRVAAIRAGTDALNFRVNKVFRRL